jgi:ABC-type dipeptide/oligopeptide/nickel transport system permease component
MGVLDVVSLAILAILLVGVLFLILIAAAIPGVLAKKRHSPWAEAINVAGWVGVLLPPIWMLALIAAFVRPQVGEGRKSQSAKTRQPNSLRRLRISRNGSPLCRTTFTL